MARKRDNEKKSYSNGDNCNGKQLETITLENGYNKASVMEKVITRMINGESIRQICTDSDMPNRVTLLRWMHDDGGEYAAAIAHARELSAEADLDDMQHTLNEVRAGIIDPLTARTIIWAKQWMAAKKRPNKYGDKIQHEVTGKITETDVTQIIDASTAADAYKRAIEATKGA